MPEELVSLLFSIGELVQLSIEDYFAKSGSLMIYAAHMRDRLPDSAARPEEPV